MSDSSREQREYDEFEEWVDALDPDTAVVDDPADLRAIADAADDLHTVQSRLRDAVDAARANGRTWTQIAVGLGVSRQAATKRYTNEQRATSVSRTKTTAKPAKVNTAKTKTKVPVAKTQVSRLRGGRVAPHDELRQTTRESGDVGFDSDTQRRDTHDVAAHDKRHG